MSLARSAYIADVAKVRTIADADGRRITLVSMIVLNFRPLISVAYFGRKIHNAMYPRCAIIGTAVVSEYLLPWRHKVSDVRTGRTMESRYW